MIIDLHQDIILSYEDQIEQFINYDPTTYKNTQDTNVGSYVDYIKSGIGCVFGAIRAYDIQGDLNNNPHIQFNKNKIEKYIHQYHMLENKGCTIIKNKIDYKKKGLNIVLHIEGLDYTHPLDEIHNLYNKGVRSIGFVRNFDNALAACNKSQGGLTDTGKKMIEQCNELGIIIDVAHMSHQSMMETLQISSQPIINSHSNLSFFHTHSRNVSDTFLIELADRGGVLGLSVCRSFIGAEKSHIKGYIEQVKYLRNLIGDDSIAFGSDFHGLEKHDIIDQMASIRSTHTLYEQFHEEFGDGFTNKFFCENAQHIINQIL